MAAITPRELIEHADGVYLNLREDRYLGDYALGYTAVRTIKKNPIEWWYESPFNTVLPVEAKDQKTFERGTAAHVMFLEGPEVYAEVYGVMPTKESHPGYLSGGEELRQACADYSLPQSGTLEQMEDRLRLRNPEILLLSDVVKAWLRSGFKVIRPADDTRIKLLHQMAMRTRQQLGLGEDDLTLREAFEGGLSEVSVFWTDENGIRHRARFDKLKPNITLDLKTITEWKNGDFKLSLLREVVIKGYIGQWVHYHVARQKLREFVAKGMVDGGTPEQRALLEEIALAEDWAWGWVFAKMNGFPAVRGIIMKPEDRLLPQFVRADQERDEALAKFIYHRDYFGLEPGVMWFDTEVIWEPEHTDWPTSSVFAEDL